MKATIKFKVFFLFFGRGKKEKSMVVILASTYQLSPTSKTTWLIPLQGDNQLCKIVVHQEQQNSKMSSALWFLWRRFSSCQDSRGCRQLLTTQYRQPPPKKTRRHLGLKQSKLTVEEMKSGAYVLVFIKVRENLNFAGEEHWVTCWAWADA